MNTKTFTQAEQELMNKTNGANNTATPAPKATERPSKPSGATNFPAKEERGDVEATEGLTRVRREQAVIRKNDRAKREASLVREGIEHAVRDQTVYTSAYNQTLQILNSEEFQAVVVENLDEELPALEPDQAVSEAVVNFFSGTKVFAALPNGMTAKLPSAS